MGWRVECLGLEMAHLLSTVERYGHRTLGGGDSVCSVDQLESWTGPDCLSTCAVCFNVGVCYRQLVLKGDLGQ